LSQHNIDVLVVGAGPVGLFCANELIRQGLSCRIIDKKSGLSEHSKALGLHIRTLDLFTDCQLIDDFLTEGNPVEGVLLKSKGKTLVDATFNDIKANWHYLIDLPQNKTEAIFNKHLEKKGVSVEWNTELTHLSQSPTEITATIRKPNNKIELFNATWLIACDGAHSTVRHQVGAEFKGSAYSQEWWLADLMVDWPLPANRMSIYISEKGPLACFPMGNKRYRLVMTAATKSTGDPTLQDIENTFKDRSSDQAVLSAPIWLSRFSIHHRQIQNYRFDRVFFAGDAAHIHSPMGGQGLNTGIQDAYNLAWKLALVEKKKAKPDLLNSYHEERYPVGLDVLKKTDIMTRMILLKNPLAVALRNRMIGFVTSFKFIRNKLANNLAELTISYAKSPIVQQTGCKRGMKAGAFIPSFSLTDPTHAKTLDSNEIVQGIQHHLFIFEGTKTKKNQALITLAKELAQKHPTTMQVHLVLAKKAELVSDKIHLWVDENQAQQTLGIKKPTLILVRPDKYIGIVKKSINSKTTLNDFYLM